MTVISIKTKNFTPFLLCSEIIICCSIWLFFIIWYYLLVFKENACSFMGDNHWQEQIRTPRYIGIFDFNFWFSKWQPWNHTYSSAVNSKVSNHGELVNIYYYHHDTNSQLTMWKLFFIKAYVLDLVI